MKQDQESCMHLWIYRYHNYVLVFKDGSEKRNFQEHDVRYTHSCNSRKIADRILIYTSKTLAALFVMEDYIDKRIPGLLIC